MTIASAIIDTHALLEVVYTSALAGVGTVAAYAVAVVGITRAQECRRAEPAPARDALRRARDRHPGGMRLGHRDGHHDHGHQVVVAMRGTRRSSCAGRLLVPGGDRERVSRVPATRSRRAVLRPQGQAGRRFANEVPTRRSPGYFGCGTMRMYGRGDFQPFG